MSRVKRALKKIVAVKPEQKSEKGATAKSWYDLLTSQPGIAKDAGHRINMTISCRDCDYIPKVKNAGAIIKKDGKSYQVMHNGLLVESGGYFGEWMGEIIETLKGHHEPQEEKVFYEILKRVPAGGSMIELGSYWGYYSMWFNKSVKNARNYCCEPDSENLKLGKRNAKANNVDGVTFINAAAGKDDGKMISFQPQEDENRPKEHIPIRTIDSILAEYKEKKFDLVHMDVQGAELAALQGAEQSIMQGKVRFVIVSTHHYLVSEDVLMHEKCLELIRSWDGHVIVEHAIHESFSGDGLIAASFFEEDKNLEIEVSDNRMQDSLFRSYLRDMQILKDAYEDLRAKHK